MIGSYAQFHRSLFLYSILFIVALASVAFYFQAPPPVEAGSGDKLSGYAWSSNIGWISFNCTDGGTCATADYGVTADLSGNLSGYAWSSNIGWINFNDQPGECPIRADNPTCAPTYTQSTGLVSGWAQACAGTVNGDCTGADRTDGWDGWISLTGTGPAYGVSVAGCDWNGYAWGGPVVGWMSFNGTAPNYKVLGTGSACGECADGIDNGDAEDSRFDANDPGCLDDFGVYDPTRLTEVDPPRPECNDFKDNEGDGFCDWNGCTVDSIPLPADPECVDSSDDNESPESVECSDTIDNADAEDTLSDAGDPGCYTPYPACVYDPSDNDETLIVAACSNCIDDDNDGLADEEDPSCWTDPRDPASFDPTATNEGKIKIIEVLPQ